MARANTTIAPAFAQLSAASLIGLVALPILFGGDSVGTDDAVGEFRLREALWLGAALVIVFWLLRLAPALSRALTSLLASVAIDTAPTVARTRSPEAGATVARWLVATGYVLVAQAMVRRPFVAVLGTSFKPSLIEALFASVALALLLVALYSLHRAARPLLEAAAWHVLDAVVATSGSDTATGAPSAQQRASGRAAAEGTEASHSSPTPAGGVVEVTVAAVTVAARSEEATIPEADAEATMPPVEGEATQLDAHRRSNAPPTDVEADLPRAGPAGETLPGGR